MEGPERQEFNRGVLCVYRVTSADASYFWAPAITRSDLERLAKLLELAVGSSHAGERDSATLKAGDLLRKKGMTITEVILSPAAPPPPLFRSQRDKIRFATVNSDALTTWEQRFAANISQQRKPLSLKQAVHLEEIIERLLAKGRRP
jgi:hypothetical protein